MRVHLSRKRLPRPGKLDGKDVPAVLGKVVARTQLQVYDPMRALVDSGLARLDEGRRRR